MIYSPAWRLKFAPPRNLDPVQTDEFKRVRSLQIANGRKCIKIARSTGNRCGQLAMIGSDFCKLHKGWFRAVQEEQRRHPGKVVIKIRSGAARKDALAALGAGPWPDGLPRYKRFRELGPLGRGRLFEAWANRELDPATWKYELERERIRVPAKVEKRMDLKSGLAQGQAPGRKRPRVT